MNSTPSIFNKPSSTRQILTETSPVEELMAFLNLYLDPYTANKIESKASEHAKNPDTEISDLLREIRRSVQTYLDSEGERIKREIVRTINIYQDEMMKTEDCVKEEEISALHICDDKKLDASRRLVKHLENIIPEARRSSILRKTSHVSKEELQSFLPELEEDLFDYCEEKKLQIKENLDLALDHFLKDLLILSKQRTMASKMEVLETSLERENVLPEIKAALNDKAEEIRSKLMSPRLSLTPDTTQEIIDLAQDVTKLAQNTSKHFKKMAKDFDDTVTYVCHDEP